MSKRAPDEFAVVRRAPLIVPPDFDLRPPDPGAPRPNIGTTADQARYRALEQTIRRELDRYRDVGIAVADGYEPFLPGLPQPVVHYTKKSHGLAAAFGFDPAKPTSLLYRREPGGGYTLTGVMYTAPWWTDEAALDARVPLAIAPWHQHVDLCVPGRRHRERWTETRDGRPLFGPKSPIATEAECEAVGGKFVERAFGWMVHVEAFAPHGRATESTR